MTKRPKGYCMTTQIEIRRVIKTLPAGDESSMLLAWADYTISDLKTRIFELEDKLCEIRKKHETI